MTVLPMTPTRALHTAFSFPSSGEPREMYNEVTRQILGGVIQKVKAAGKSVSDSLALVEPPGRSRARPPAS